MIIINKKYSPKDTEHSFEAESSYMCLQAFVKLVEVASKS